MGLTRKVTAHVEFIIMWRLQVVKFDPTFSFSETKGVFLGSRSLKDCWHVKTREAEHWLSKEHTRILRRGDLICLAVFDVEYCEGEHCDLVTEMLSVWKQPPVWTCVSSVAPSNGRSWQVFIPPSALNLISFPRQWGPEGMSRKGGWGKREREREKSGMRFWFYNFLPGH